MRAIVSKNFQSIDLLSCLAIRYTLLCRTACYSDTSRIVAVITNVYRYAETVGFDVESGAIDLRLAIRRVAKEKTRPQSMASIATCF